jgi:hypothetical protein
LDLEDQITKETLVSRDGEVVNSRLRELLGTITPAIDNERTGA